MRLRLSALNEVSVQMKKSFRGAASYVDRILEGEKAVDLPVWAPNDRVGAGNSATMSR
jgi:hypothetical protein